MQVKSRIMVDKANFSRFDADYELPMPEHALPKRVGAESLTDDELLFASPIVYGFSLSDKLWREYHYAPIILRFAAHVYTVQSSTTSITSRRSTGTTRHSPVWS